MSFFTQLLNGLQLGSIYALVALGYTMVYGIILLLNFAHGDIIMAGAYISWIAMAQLGIHPALAALLSIVGCMALGVAIDKIAYAPLREAPRLSVLITAIGVSYFLESGSQLIFGADAKVVPAFVNLTTVSVGSVTLSLTAILTVAITCISTVVLTFLAQKTRLGKAMRAVSEDMGASMLTVPFRSPLPLVLRLRVSEQFSTAWRITKQRPPWALCWGQRLLLRRSWEASVPFPAPSLEALLLASLKLP